MSYNTPFTKSNLDYYLSELAREFRRLNGKSCPAEIILIGEASLLVNYGFREMTYDMDAIISASSAMKDAINKVGDQYGLPNGWLNTDFITTKSFTPKLIEYSEYYRTFANILTIRTIASEYLIAMKLMSGRKYKNDLSDIIGILREHQNNGKTLGREHIDRAVCSLYGNWKDIPDDSRSFIDSVLEHGDYEILFQQYQDTERQVREVLLDLPENDKSMLNENNIAEIIEKARKVKHKSQTV